MEEEKKRIKENEKGEKRDERLSLTAPIFSSYFALGKRTASEYRQERVHRLLVPGVCLSLTAGLPLSSNMAAMLRTQCRLS